MKVSRLIIMILLFIANQPVIKAQSGQDTTGKKPNSVAADDPTQFFTRIEIFNELQHHTGDIYLNQTTFRTIVKLGKKFTSRVDIPFVYNSFSSAAGYKQFGISDISFRLLGYKIMESPKSAVTASVELSLNTAQSKLLGTGKNMIIPVVSYSRTINKRGSFVTLILQQVNSFSGDEARQTVSFSKIQAGILTPWSRRMWTVVAPTLYVDYVKGGASMNLEGRIVYATAPRTNFWGQAGVGLFGDFVLRYQWTVQFGYRYFLFRNTNWKRKEAG